MEQMELGMNSDIIRGKDFLRETLADIDNTNFKNAHDKLLQAQEIFKQNNSNEYLSICLSLLALTDYLADKNNLKKSLALLQDAAYLA